MLFIAMMDTKMDYPSRRATNQLPKGTDHFVLRKGRGRGRGGWFWHESTCLHGFFPHLLSEVLLSRNFSFFCLEITQSPSKSNGPALMLLQRNELRNEVQRLKNTYVSAFIQEGIRQIRRKDPCVRVNTR